MKNSIFCLIVERIIHGIFDIREYLLIKLKLSIIMKDYKKADTNVVITFWQEVLKRLVWDYFAAL